MMCSLLIFFVDVSYIDKEFETFGRVHKGFYEMNEVPSVQLIGPHIPCVTS